MKRTHCILNVKTAIVLLLSFLAISCNKKDCSALQNKANETQKNMDKSFEDYSNDCDLICSEFDAFKDRKPETVLAQMTFEGCNNNIDKANKIVNVGLPAYAQNSTSPEVIEMKRINTEQRVPDSTSYELYKNLLPSAIAAFNECENQK